jgi:hypothetical protein
VKLDGGQFQVFGDVGVVDLQCLLHLQPFDHLGGV